MSRHLNPLRSLLAALALLAIASCAPPPQNGTADRAYEVLNDALVDHHGEYALSEGFVDTSAGRYHYVETGSGPTLILYHGFPSFWYAWKNVIPVLAGHFRVIALDGLGANLTDKPADLATYRLEALAGQLNEVIDELAGDEPVTLVGHDWGGALVWSFAQAYPERVAAMVSISAPPLNLFLELLSSDPVQQKASAYVERLKELAMSEEIPESAAARLTDLGYGKLQETGLISQRDYDAFGRGLAQAGHLRGTTKWYAANVPAPTAIGAGDFWPSREANAEVRSMVIWGEDDGTFVPRFLELAGDYARPLRVERLADTGHWPMFEAAARTNALLLDFLLNGGAD